MAALTTIDLPLKKIASGKVRDLFEVPQSRELLFISSDRISCFDVILKTGIPDKGAVLTQLSEFWFQLLQSKIPKLRTHFISLGLSSTLEDQVPQEKSSDLEKRSMIVKRLKVFPIESIVRGYITGSGLQSYKKDGTLHGVILPEGLQESQKLEEPLWTPSTKAEQGAKDENISREEAASLITQEYPENGADYAAQIEDLSLAIYKQASTHCAERGIILADTKLEFGLDESTSPPSVVLIDEVLTPDSSRFWSAEKYAVGRAQESFDKQPVRDWLTSQGLAGKEGVELPTEVVERTSQTYREAYRMLVGKAWE